MTTMKFKIGFTIAGETLFGLIAKFLPIEDLSIEEFVDKTPQARSARARALKQAEPKSLAPKSLARPKVRGRSKGLSLDTGANAVILELLADGKPHRAAEMQPLMSARGYAPTGIGSRLDRLKKHGAVFQPDFGLWQLTNVDMTHAING